MTCGVAPKPVFFTEEMLYLKGEARRASALVGENGVCLLSQASAQNVEGDGNTCDHQPQCSSALFAMRNVSARTSPPGPLAGGPRNDCRRAIRCQPRGRRCPV
jgi:hypothetical protein